MLDAQKMRDILMGPRASRHTRPSSTDMAVRSVTQTVGVLWGTGGDSGVSDLVHLPWVPLSCQEVGALFGAFHAPWWLAGGYALEAYVGYPYRSHGDIDVLVLRQNLNTLHTLLDGFELYLADPPGSLRRWERREPLPAGVHDIWCRERASRAWQLQLMVDEVDGDEWVSRRDSRVRRPWSGLGWTLPGIRVLAPEVQLFYKALTPRPKDEQDREMVWPLLGEEARAWLKHAVAEAYGARSPWYGL